MERFFTYDIRNQEIDVSLRIGKGSCLEKSNRAVEMYLRRRYGVNGWDFANITWHDSEAAALKSERRKMIEHVEIHGVLPVANRARGGGGRQIYVKCKALKWSGERCCNDALVRNYGYCGIHRR